VEIKIKSKTIKTENINFDEFIEITLSIIEEELEKIKNND
jgi:hypothetical protein